MFQPYDKVMKISENLTIGITNFLATSYRTPTNTNERNVPPNASSHTIGDQEPMIANSRHISLKVSNALFIQSER